MCHRILTLMGKAKISSICRCWIPNLPSCQNTWEEFFFECNCIQYSVSQLRFGHSLTSFNSHRICSSASPLPYEILIGPGWKWGSNIILDYGNFANHRSNIGVKYISDIIAFTLNNSGRYARCNCKLLEGRYGYNSFIHYIN